MWRQGWTDKEIAQRLEVSRWAVHRFRRKHELTANRRNERGRW